ncbi:GNAT family N-acetyltransferase [uncultured Alsobacter sp.]|uniref:GNAT family N-acetyltransferase n=1 Tax=uncultured Alsobacter sp. TaxID=1748258 RepID=UPI0025FDDAD6|nr:GNAT family N-acetyltransferase [uncultured Alsobacter sp.]
MKADALDASAAASDFGLSVQAHRDPWILEADWRALEDKGDCSPYQRFAWVSAWYKHVSAARRQQVVVVTFSNSAGKIICLFPLVVDTAGPLSILRYAGGDHSNINGPILDPSSVGDLSALPTSVWLTSLASAVGRIDLIDLKRQPPMWGEHPNPLAQVRSYRTESMAVLLLQETPGQCPPKLSKSTRRKFTQKQKWLDDIAPTSYRRLVEPADIQAALDAFLLQKRQRLAKQKIADPFAEKGVEAFIREAATPQASGCKPGLSVYALTCGAETVAVMGCCESRGRLSGSIISYDASPQYSRCSPGEILALSVIRDAYHDGLAVFDLGAGNDAYKGRFCDKGEDLVSVTWPVTFAGRIMDEAVRLSRSAKRRVMRAREQLKRPAAAAQPETAETAGPA